MGSRRSVEMQEVARRPAAAAGTPERMRSGGARSNRPDQRSRLLKAIVEVAASDGYPQAKIAVIAERAGVSRATFYEQFEGKEEGFLLAYREQAERISSELGEAVTRGAPEEATHTLISAIVVFAEREPQVFGFLTHEAMLAGAAAQEERDRLLARLEACLDDARIRAAGDSLTPDLPARMLIGGVIRVLGMRMRRGEGRPTRLLPDLMTWTDLYNAPRKASTRTAVAPASELLRQHTQQTALALVTPQPLPRGRHRLPVTVVRRVQRERILHATAEATSKKGYADTTVADIVAAAGLSRAVFYAHLADKREASVEATKLFFQQAIAVMAAAFFTASGKWPEQVWASGRALTSFLATAPSFAHLVFIESYAPGPASARLTDDLFLGFTVFIDDGYRYRPEAAKVPRIASEAITGAILEIAASYTRRGRVAELPALLPLSSYLILAPFMGVQAANSFVDARMRGTPG
jgi:AcrR family transcriptional regulator